VERRLTTILAADVVGYSRLTATDEADTLARVKTHREELIEPKAAAYHGRVVKLMGDGILMEFGSVVDAVSFAADVQRAMAERNADVPADRQIHYRIGVNLGDIVVDGDDILGDGVNIAARLETMADPGGICLSGKVHDEVKNKLEFEFEDLGRQRVKNIPEPVRAFKVRIESRQADQLLAAPKRTRALLSLWRIAAIVVATLLAGAAAVLWLRPWETRLEPAAEDRMAFPLPDKPSIVVLPFTNISDDAGQEYFVDGITEDLTTDLAKLPAIFVISRNSAFTYKGRSVEIRQVAEDLGVRYVLEGSARRVGDRVRINAQLIDAKTGGHLWAERYDGSVDDVFTLQDKVTAKIVEALAVKLLPGDIERMSRDGTDNVAAHDAYLLGLSAYYRRTPEDNARAAAYFERAIGLDPDYAAAHTALAKVYVQAALGEQAYADELGIFWTEGYTRAARMLDKGMARPSADARTLNSWLALRKHQHGRAIAEAEAALALNPNDAEALEALAEALIYSGRPQDGIIQAQKAMAQNPLLLGRPLYLIGLAEFALGDSDRAIERLARAIELAPAHRPEFSGLLAAAYGELGRAAEAEAAFADYQEGLLNRPALAWSVEPQPFANPRSHTWWRVDLAWAVYAHPFASRDVLERLAKGLKSAGATSGIGGFLPMYAENRLSGKELGALLFGSSISGKGFRPGETLWRQDRAADGAVRHRGYPVHPGLERAATGIGRIEGDRLCERWPGPGLGPDAALDTCVAIYRIADSKARLRWGDYVMATDTGPHPFSRID
jgi:TolB-like protein/class 3 adenylate cyclase